MFKCNFSDTIQPSFLGDFVDEKDKLFCTLHFAENKKECDGENCILQKILSKLEKKNEWKEIIIWGESKQAIL